MAETEKLKAALVWHDYAIRALTDAVQLIEHCTTEPHDHAAVNNKLVMAHNALKQAQLVQTIGSEDA